MNGTKSVLASLQQTSSSARTSHSPRLPCGFVLVNLIFFGSWTIFTRAHGRCLLPEAQASKGRLPSSSGRLCVGTGTPLLYLKAKSASKTGSPGLQVLHRSHHYLGWVKSEWVFSRKRSRAWVRSHAVAPDDCD